MQRAIALACSAVGVLAGGLVWRSPEAVAVGSAALLLVACSWALARPPRSAAWSDVTVPRRVSRGGVAVAEIALQIVGSDRWLTAEGDGARVRVRSDASIAWPIDTTRRGWQPGGPSHLVFADPLGLRRTVLAERAAPPVLVVPRITPVAPLAIRHRDEGLLAESGGGMQFHALREYVVGDPLRAVHWRTSARVGTLVVRETVDEVAPGLLVVLETRMAAYQRTASAFSDPDLSLFEDAVDLAASACHANMAHGHTVWLTTTSPKAAIRSVDRRSWAAALDWLALVAPADADGSRRIEGVTRQVRASAVVLVTGPHAQVTGLRPQQGSATLTTMRVGR